MKNSSYPLTIALIFLAISLTGCFGGKSQQSALVHGLNESGADNGVSAADSAIVLSVKPKVVSIYGGRAEDIKAGDRVPLDAILRSDSTGNARLELPDHSTISVSSDSEIALYDVAGGTGKDTGLVGGAKSLGRSMTGRATRNRSLAVTGNSSQTSIGIRGFSAGSN